MKYLKTAKAFVLLAAIILSIILTSQAAFASVKWLSSIPVKVIGPNDESAPARLALDAKGNIYVTDRRNNKNRVIVFDRAGKLVGAHGGFKSPVGIAVDDSGNIYIGCAETGSVDVYNPDFTFSRKLGIGDGEFKFPSSISVTSSGLVFVVDTKGNTVKVYNANGSAAFTFGSYGKGDGKFNEPYGIAIDEALGEIYITDRSIITVSDPKYNFGAPQTVGGARVQVFTLNGLFKRSFGEFGSGPGQMRMPIGIAADGAGKLYITDTNLAVVHIFTASGIWVETVSDSAHVLKTPIGIVIGKDKRMFVASSNGGSLEVYGLDGYTTMAVSQKSLSFTAVAGEANPAAQVVTVSNSGTGDLVWTASAETTDGLKWLAVTQTGTAGPGSSSDLSVSVDTKALGNLGGSYSGSITLRAAGAEEIIAVTLAVSAPPTILSVTPGALTFSAQQNGSIPMAKSFTISNVGGGNMTWSAAKTTAAEWLKLDVSTPFLIVSLNTTSLNPGIYNGAVTVTAPGAQGSPASLGVTVQIVEAGTVKVSSNIEAKFTITGKETFSHSGKSWINEMVTPGDYTIAFDHIAGYLKPVTRKFTVKTGQETVLNGDYSKKAVPTHLLAGSADPSMEMKVSLYPLESGKMPRTFTPFSAANSLRVASGDLDGSGSGKIIVTDYKATVKVFSDQGGDALASYELPQGYKDADVAVGDIDGDGTLDILVAADNQKLGRVIKVLSYAADTLEEKSTLFTEEKDGGFAMALGDVNEDGALDLIIADADGVRAFAVRQGALTQLWTKSGSYGAPQIAAGDINNDGISEIAVSYDYVKENRRRGGNNEKASLVTILKGTGEDFGLTIEPFKDLGYAKASTITMGDVDGDGADELIIGAGPADENEPIVRIFEGDGTNAGMMKPLNGKNGVNVGLGMFQ